MRTAEIGKLMAEISKKAVDVRKFKKNGYFFYRKAQAKVL